MNELPFGLDSKKTFASLSPADLQSLGKRASVEYLSGVTSLNDSIIKMAREYPSISPHQVQRVIEYANQETFAKLFADNEKYASDKNIEFDVADPSVILHELNSTALPAVMSAPPDEYSCAPVKMASSSVEADIELARVFGVDPALPGYDETVKIAYTEDGKFEVLERIFNPGKTKTAGPMDGFAPQPAAQPQQQPMPAGQPGQSRAAANGDTHNDQMLELQREIELAKKRQELQKVEQQTMNQMNPGGPMVPAPPPPMPGQDAGGGAPMQGAAPDAGAAAGPMGPPPAAPDAGAAAGGPPPEQQPEQQIPDPMAGAITAPPGANEPLKQAMAYIKSGRPNANLLMKAAGVAVSRDAIKQATARRAEYAYANPWGEVIRSKQKLAKLLDDASDALHKNQALEEEARSEFQHKFAQELHSGTNFGEVMHLLDTVNPQGLRQDLTDAVPYLRKHGFDLVKARAEAIEYEMTKKASARAPNPNHPLAQAYSTLTKIAKATPVLKTAFAQVKERYDLVNRALSEAMVNASAR